MEKVTVSKEVAEAIEDVRQYYSKAEIIANIYNGRQGAIYGTNMPTLIEYAKHNGIETLMRALVIGYQVEQTPEERVREFYESFNAEIMEHVYARTAIRSTLALLGITIEGINADKP